MKKFPRIHGRIGETGLIPKHDDELAAANERIRRLINAGDAMAPMLTCDYRSDDALRNWTKAKEAKP